MAPGPHESLDEAIKKTIQSLYTLQSSTHGYLGPETQQALIGEIQHLSRSLGQLHSLAQAPAPNTDAAVSQPQHPLANAFLTPEIIEYVDAARNPDIYTREFVERVHKGNAYLKGKAEGLAYLRDSLGREMREAWPEMAPQVDSMIGKER